MLTWLRSEATVALLQHSIDSGYWRTWDYPLDELLLVSLFYHGEKDIPLPAPETKIRSLAAYRRAVVRRITQRAQELIRCARERGTYRVGDIAVSVPHHIMVDLQRAAS